MEIGQADTEQAERRLVAELLDRAAGARWGRFNPPGEGVDYRLEDDALVGSALVWDEQVVIHLQLFPKDQPTRNESSAEQSRPRVFRRYLRRSGPSAE